MRRMIEVIDAEYGGAEGYLRNYLKFSEKDIAMIRNNLLAVESHETALRSNSFVFHDEYTPSLTKAVL
ncbi:hypothetical protein V1517DRAFT_327653 [Lipomyces orientalis]|uniref:Uncharacterized protein n=1 Tax=Lipomyces orientalis TaxID=1233043 RepID=A0ACC3TJH5_9ASCO